MLKLQEMNLLHKKSSSSAYKYKNPKTSSYLKSTSFYYSQSEYTHF